VIETRVHFSIDTAGEWPVPSSLRLACKIALGCFEGYLAAISFERRAVMEGVPVIGRYR